MIVEKKLLKDYVQEAFDDAGQDRTRKEQSILDRLPAEDVRPEVHAKWIYSGVYRSKEGLQVGMFECSNCHVLKMESSKYCPSCGAYMYPPRGLRALLKLYEN